MKRILACILSAAALVAFSSCGKTASVGEYTLNAIYGEPFTLPEVCEVTAPDGGEAEVYGNTFTVEQYGEYFARGNGNTYRIRVTDGAAPLVRLSYEKAYVEEGKLFTLPALTVSSGAVSAEYKESLSVDGKNYQIPQSRSISASAGGEYVYRVTAKNEAAETTKECRITAVPAGDYRLGIIAELGEPYGLSQCGDFFGYNASYTTEKRYGNDSGSLKLK